MNSSALFIITGDPRLSPRPAEAIRIAAGVGTWKKTDVRVYLRDSAVLSLCDCTDELVDGDSFSRYLPILGDWGRPIYVQHGAPMLAQMGQPSLPCEEIDDTRLAALAAGSSFVLRF
ncbi:MAG TPA: hypothetical protein VGK40_12060 [Verrucomicrobiae bacterium]|jgi:hypothetical protein